MKKITVAFLLLILAGAVPVPCRAAENGKQVSRDGFTFVLPERWSIPKDKQPKGRRKAKEEIIVLTKDGPALNEIDIRKRLIATPFAHTRKALAKGMMPQEMAEIVLNDLELDESLKNLRIIENRPATVAGIPGFRLVFSYRSNGKLQYQCVYYGFQKEEMFYNIFFTAPKRHYFETNLPAFEAIVKGLQPDGQQAAGWGPGEQH